MLRGPQFGSPPQPCELDVATTSSKRPSRSPARPSRRLASSGTSVTIPVGTRHPTPRKSYMATRLCSHFPHVYDGIVYLYDCEDTLAWDGSVTLTRIR